nr:hypothetical protein [Tanacetum cinerariifolium]
MIDKHDLCVLKSVAKPIKKTVASESSKKPRNKVRKLHEHFGNIYKWSYIKFTPSGYMWKPKSGKEHVNPNVSLPLGNASRIANVKDTMTSRRSIVSNSPLSSNSFAARRDNSIHHRLWVLKAHDEKSQASKDDENLDKMKEKGDACIFEDHVSSDAVPQCLTTALEQGSLSPSPQSQENAPHSAETVTTSNELDLLFSLMFDELPNGTTQVVSKSSIVTTADPPNQHQQQHTFPSTSATVVADTPPMNIHIRPDTTSQPPTQAPICHCQ